MWVFAERTKCGTWTNQEAQSFKPQMPPFTHRASLLVVERADAAARAQLGIGWHEVSPPEDEELSFYRRSRELLEELNAMRPLSQEPSYVLSDLTVSSDDEDDSHEYRGYWFSLRASLSERIRERYLGGVIAADYRLPPHYEGIDGFFANRFQFPFHGREDTPLEELQGDKVVRVMWVALPSCVWVRGRPTLRRSLEHFHALKERWKLLPSPLLSNEEKRCKSLNPIL